MKVVAIGLSHHTAPLALRERLCYPTNEVGAALEQIVRLPHVEEAVLLSTCNRVEVYAASAEPEAALAELRSYLGASRHLESERLSAHLYEHDGLAAVHHLFRVTSALDSLVVGESQILGQIKDAYGTAARVGTVGAWLGRLVERAFSVAKRIRTETKIAEGSASVSAAAVDLAQSIFGNLSGHTLLLIGTGKMSTLAARHLREAGTGQILVTGRTLESATSLAAQVDGKAHPMADLDRLLVAADVVITSTASPSPILGKPLMTQIIKQRRHRPLFLVDIAMPRDIDPQVAELPNVFLYNLDDLQSVVSENMRSRRQEAQLAERIVESEVHQFSTWLSSQAAVPTIKALRAYATQIVEHELARTLPALDPAAHDKVRAMASAIANKLLHAPISALRQDGTLTAIVEKLYPLAPAELIAGKASGELPAMSVAASAQANPTGSPNDERASSHFAPSGSASGSGAAAVTNAKIKESR